MTTRHHQLPGLTLLALTAAVLAGCASTRVDPDAAWLRRQALPPAPAADPSALPPLVDCAPDSPERPLCPAIQRDTAALDDIEATCETLVAAPETAFTGRRCLAALALHRASGLSVQTRETTADDAPIDFTTQEAQLVEQWSAGLRTALEHLERAAELAPSIAALQRHRATHALALLTLTTHSDVLNVSAEAARATVLEADAALADHAAEDSALRDVVLGHIRLLVEHAELDLAAALLDTLATALPHDRAVATAQARFQLAHGDLDASMPALDRAAALGATDPIVLAARLELALVALDLERATSAAGDLVTRIPDTPDEAAHVLRTLAGDAPRSPLARRTAPLRNTPGALAELALEVVDSDPAAGLALALEGHRGDPLRLTPVLAISRALRAHYDRADVAAEQWMALLDRLRSTGAEAPDATLDQVRMFTADALIGAGRREEAAGVLQRVEDPGLRAGETFERLWQAATTR